jgi:basic amino acid/polyamine antiporter, APA family
MAGTAAKPTGTLPVPRPASRGNLLQVLGVSFGVAVLIGNTILVGILRTPGDVAARLPNPGLFLGVWILGGLFALLATLSIAEPGAMLAQSGGQYVIVRRGLGVYPGFVVGWTDWMSTCGTIALGAMVFTEYLEPLVPAVRGNRVPGAVALALAFGLLLWRGIRIGDLSQQILSALKAAAFGLLIGVCLVAPLPPTGAIAPAALPGGMALITAAVLAIQAVIYTYDGWNGPLYFGEEVKDGGRGIPRAMVIGVLLVILIYVLLNVAFLRVLGLGRMAGEPFVAAAAGRALFGAQGDLVIRSLVLLSILSGINATCLMAPRVVFAMSRDRLLPRGFETVNAGGTPTVGHWASIGVAVGFLVSGTFDTVLALCAFFFVLQYTLSLVSLFALRRNEPDAPRPFRVPGYPFTPGLALAASLAFLGGSVVTDWSNSWKSLVLLAVSYPIYRLVIASMRPEA